jgi:hypothetical protein
VFIYFWVSSSEEFSVSQYTTLPGLPLAAGLSHQTHGYAQLLASGSEQCFPGLTDKRNLSLIPLSRRAPSQSDEALQAAQFLTHSSSPGHHDHA